MKEPKSLYQSPSGASGSVSTQFFKRCNSENEIARSATRYKRCCQTGAGRLANRIFGNCAHPEDRADQIFSSLALSDRVGLIHKLFVRRLHIGSGGGFGFNASFREADQSAAHRQMPLFRNTPDLNGQSGRNRHALPY
jgi:hypothetical protein